MCSSREKAAGGKEQGGRGAQEVLCIVYIVIGHSKDFVFYYSEFYRSQCLGLSRRETQLDLNYKGVPLTSRGENRMQGDKKGDSGSEHGVVMGRRRLVGYF